MAAENALELPLDRHEITEDALSLIMHNLNLNIAVIYSYCTTNFLQIEMAESNAENVFESIHKNLGNLYLYAENLFTEVKAKNNADKFNFISLLKKIEAITSTAANLGNILLEQKKAPQKEHMDSGRLAAVIDEMSDINNEESIDSDKLNFIIDEMSYINLDLENIFQKHGMPETENMSSEADNIGVSDTELSEMLALLRQAFSKDEKKKIFLSPEDAEKFSGWLNHWESFYLCVIGAKADLAEICDQISMLIMSCEGGLLGCQKIWTEAVTLTDKAFMPAKTQKSLSLPNLNSVKKIKRKGLNVLNKNKNETNILNHAAIQLPENYAAGKAVNNGGCFFDSMASILNAKFQTNDFTEKSLRMYCYDFYKENTEKMTAWCADSSLSDLSNYSCIQYTHEEINQYYLSGLRFLWGSPEIEGRIFCELFKIPGLYKIEVMRVEDCSDNVIGRFYITAKSGIRALTNEEKIDYRYPVVIVGQDELHTVPVLPLQIISPKENILPLSVSDQDEQTNNKSDKSDKSMQINNKFIKASRSSDEEDVNIKILSKNPANVSQRKRSLSSLGQNHFAIFSESASHSKKCKIEKTENPENSENSDNSENSENSENLTDEALENIDLNLSPPHVSLDSEPQSALFSLRQ